MFLSLHAKNFEERSVYYRILKKIIPFTFGETLTFLYLCKRIKYL